MNRTIAAALALAAGVIPGIAAAAPATPVPTRDYFNDTYKAERVLDWGERPVWSFDSSKIAFTIDDEHAGPAYELDVATRKVRCITCKWGASAFVSRIYYLADGSYLISGPLSLATAESMIAPKPRVPGKTELYWMPADGSTPPQALGAVAGGEIAIDYDHSPEGTTRIAWGEFGAVNRMVVGDVVNDGKRAWLVNRTQLYSNPPAPNGTRATLTETYDFIDDGKSILFYTIETGLPTTSMYKLEMATGKVTAMPTDGQHNETHSFPDVRYGLEESNRAADSTSPYRAVSGHRTPLLQWLLDQNKTPDSAAIAEKYANKPFDLYLVDWNTGKRRRLSNTFEMGGEAHQSSPARDGARIAYAVRPALNMKFTGQPGLYIGTFSKGK